MTSRNVAQIQLMMATNKVKMEDGSTSPVDDNVRCQYCSKDCKLANTNCGEYKWDFKMGMSLQEGKWTPFA